ncbi:hypothetical protein BH11PLA2_BH11PLA2_00670 [soil metagenome]
MHRSIVRLIAVREIRDLLRDRRTVMLILVLPVVLYPLFGLVSILFAKSMSDQTSRVGVVGLSNLPKDPTPLIDGDHFAEAFTKSDSPDALTKLSIVPLDGDPEASLTTRTIDVAMIVPADFSQQLAAGMLPTLTVLDRDGDEKSKLAAKRLDTVLRAWQAKLRETKFLKAGLPKDFDRVFELIDPQSAKPALKKAADELRDTFVKVFPFILMMWLVAGAIQPAVDLTAGEKERGTMETLLISPAERIEIVLGKFIAVTFFSYASVVWNVFWLAVAAIVLEFVLGNSIIFVPGLLGCLILGIPLAMFFSAISLALGVFARSTKEGQYYLMPLILVTMPLALASMTPGVELTLGRALIPVTGAMLFQQKLLNVYGEAIPWLMLLPVLGSLAVSVAVGLWLAVVQFKRESVLFRESAGEKKSLLSMFARRG